MPIAPSPTIATEYDLFVMVFLQIIKFVDLTVFILPDLKIKNVSNVIKFNIIIYFCYLM
ncbi:hypothetical protein SA3096_04410 [Aggregatibacter actinomycetemcomitans serotype e str. SA3096]|nr:hypothetical protein SA3096_04410 [Aggregatibacter actinomycetemcomitans serotype e str. SA3096]